MSFPQGLNFRSTVGFVTDVSPATFIGTTGTYAYPFVTAQGNTVGYDVTSNLDSRNRLNTNDPRLAGILFSTNAGVAAVSFRIDLPAAGQYNIRFACGDATSAQNTKIELFDDVTSLGVILNAAASNSNNFLDATGVSRSAANWPNLNVAITKTFASTICRFKLGGVSAGNSSVIAHFYIEAVAAAFQPAWARNANTLISSGARSA